MTSGNNGVVGETKSNTESSTDSIIGTLIISEVGKYVSILSPNSNFEKHSLGFELVQGTAGFVAGIISSFIPGGFLISPLGQKTGLLDQPTQTFEFMLGAGQTLTGIGQIIFGIMGEFGGGTLDILGILGAPESFGTSMTLTGLGISINIASVAIITQGSANAIAGVSTMAMASGKEDAPTPSKTTPTATAGDGNTPPASQKPIQTAPEESSGMGGLVPGRPPKAPVGSILSGRPDVRKVISADFKDYLRKQGISTTGWHYVMETWETQAGKLIERHYWRGPGGLAFYHL